jgi:alkanesulfonate monooxygenase SsuD/methylene tetrahydromethanopterin reductase-like flavin-dependent oxidoreductase (luciferase family)
MTITTLVPGGPVHWGVMLAQGWKGELATASHADIWVIARDWAQRAEHLGFDGIWLFDHFQPYPARDDSPVLEAWTTLAVLSQATEQITLGTLVSCAAYRPPTVTAKMAQTLHILSGGRFCLGLGAGWDEPEFQFLNIPFGSAAERSDQLESSLRAARAAWPPAAGPPVLVGGEGERRTLPSAVVYADVVNWQVGLSEFRRKSRRLDELCEAVGRDPGSLRRTHAPNFQLFESEREFRLWRQDEQRGMSAADVEAYIRDRGALYGTAAAISETIEQFLDAGCGGLMTYCNEAPSLAALGQLAQIRSARR